MRNIALSTTVTLLVPVERHANANGMVGTVQGIAFIVTSVFSGLAIGFLGMGWTLAIAIVFTLARARAPALPPHPRGAARARRRAAARSSTSAAASARSRSAPGLFALIIFSTFNNLIGGVYMALMDPYGLTLFPVEWWGVVLGVASTGFIIGGIVRSRRSGSAATRSARCSSSSSSMGMLGASSRSASGGGCTPSGIWLYMALVPAVEASEQTVIQKVVPFRTQGRVFGFAQAFEAAAAPVTAFLIAPIAQFWIIPYMNSDAGQQTWGWLLGDGEARGIALVFLFSGLIMVAVALLAFTTRSYRTLSEEYEQAPDRSRARVADRAATGDADADASAAPQSGARTTSTPADAAEFEPRR